MARPAGSPITWATDGGTRTTPSGGQQAHGWDPTERPGYLNANALWGIAYDWLVYFAAKIGAATYSYDTAQTFTYTVSALGSWMPDPASTHVAHITLTGTTPHISNSAADGLGDTALTLYHSLPVPFMQGQAANLTFKSLSLTGFRMIGGEIVTVAFYKALADGGGLATLITDVASTAAAYVTDTVAIGAGETYDEAYMYFFKITLSTNNVAFGADDDCRVVSVGVTYTLARVQ